jgi:hypothetical protein
VTPDEATLAAQAYLKWLVEGGSAPLAAQVFPDVGPTPGMHLRKPAVCGEPPEYPPAVLSEFDGTLCFAGEGPESLSTSYVFADRCPLIGVDVTLDGSRVFADFILISSYASDDYPEELAVPVAELKTRRVAFPRAMGEADWYVRECLNRTYEFLGDFGTQISLIGSFKELTFEEWSALKR